MEETRLGLVLGYLLVKWLLLPPLLLIGWFILDWPMFAPWIPEPWQFPLTCVWMPLEIVGAIWLTARHARRPAETPALPRSATQPGRVRYY